MRVRVWVDEDGDTLDVVRHPSGLSLCMGDNAEVWLPDDPVQLDAVLDAIRAAVLNPDQVQP